MKDIYKIFLSYLKGHKNDLLSRVIVFDLPYQLLRAENENAILRAKGAFFSGDKLVEFLLKEIPIRKVKIYDPAAGCGDLLLRYLDRLELASSFKKSLKEWERIVFATECEESFVKLLKLRLWLLLCLKYYGEIKLGNLNIPDLSKRFCGVKCCDAIGYSLEVTPDMIIMNPPFQQIDSNGSYFWGSGKVSFAAVFIYEMYKRYKSSRIISVLPDVLRSGSRYEKLRTFLGFNINNKDAVRIYGRFDQKTDVDVFILDLNPNQEEISFIDNGEKHGRTISEDFDVHVGAVVPHRDANKGKSCFYLTADNVPSGANIMTVKEKRRSTRNPVKGPFVVIRRTSSPSDKIRCVSSIVGSNYDFHLDNHLIYLKPKMHKSGLKICQEVCNFFSSSECSAIVNNLIRCRHLTVQIIRNLIYKGAN